MRPKRTNITRTKAGCMVCRRKRKKCDQSKPSCSRCISSGSICEYVKTLEFRDATQWAEHQSRRSRGCLLQRPLPDAQDRSALSPASGPSNQVKEAPASLPTPDRTSSDCSPLQPVSNSQGAIQNDELEIIQVWPAPSPIVSSDDAPVGPMSELVNPSDDTDWFMELQMNQAPTMDFHTPPILDSSQNPQGPSMISCSLELLETNENSTGSTDVWDVLGPVLGDGSETGGWNLQFEAARRDGDIMHNGISSDDYESSACQSAPDIDMMSTPNQQNDSDESSNSSSSDIAISLDGPSYSLGLTKSPPLPKVTVGDRLYLAHFKLGIINNLPLTCNSLQIMITKLEPVRSAAMALAAANLANQHGQPSLDGKGTWTLKESHAKNSKRLMIQSTITRQTAKELPLDARLIIQILEVCYWLEMGCIRDIRNALSELDKMILSASDKILRFPNGQSIVQCWVHLRSLSATTWGPQAPYGLESKLENSVADIEPLVSTSTQAIDLVGTRALQVCKRIVVLNCMRQRGDTSKTTMQMICRWWQMLKDSDSEYSAELWDELVQVLDESELYHELDLLRSNLDACEVPDEFPLEMMESNPQPTELISSMEPIAFSDHHKAMKCVDYAFAQFICDVDMVRSLVTDTPGNNQPREPWPTRNLRWLHILFRIANSIDPIDCMKRNMYRKGLVFYLYHITLFTLGNTGLDHLESFLQHFLEVGAYYDSSFYPIQAFYFFIQALKREATSGRTIFMACLTYGGLVGKETLFSYGLDQHVIIYGRELGGRYFSDLVPLIEDVCA